MSKRLSVLALLACLALSLACAPRAMRGGEGTENPSMDNPAMSTTLDKSDIDYLVSQNLGGLFQSRFWSEQVMGSPKQPLMAIWPIQNATSEHLDDQMLTLLSSIETMLRAHAARPLQAHGLDTALRARVDQVLEEAIRRNELNGRIATQRAIGVRQALDVITGKPTTPTVYGRGGQGTARRGGHSIGVA